MRDLTRLRAAATAARDDLGLTGRWGWSGNIAHGGPRLTTLTGGGKVILDAGRRHEHVTYTPDYDDIQASVVDDDCTLGSCPHTDTPFTPAVGEAAGDEADRTHSKESPTFRFPIRRGDPNGAGFNTMALAHEIPVFQVCPDALTEDDQRVYRHDVSGFRSPVADLLAAADAETILELLDAADQLAAVKAALVEHNASVPLDFDAHPALRHLVYGEELEEEESTCSSR